MRIGHIFSFSILFALFGLNISYAQSAGSRKIKRSDVVGYTPAAAPAAPAGGLAARIAAQCGGPVLRGYDCAAHVTTEYNKEQAALEEKRKKEAEEKKQQAQQALQQALSGLGGGGGGGKGGNQQGGGNQGGGNQQGGGGNDQAGGGAPPGGQDSGAGPQSSRQSPVVPNESIEEQKKRVDDKMKDVLQRQSAGQNCPKDRRGPRGKMLGLGESKAGTVMDQGESTVPYSKGTAIYAPGKGTVSSLKDTNGECSFEMIDMDCPSGAGKCTARIKIKGACPPEVHEGAELNACSSLGKSENGDSYLQVGKMNGPRVFKADHDETATLGGRAPSYGQPSGSRR